MIAKTRKKKTKIKPTATSLMPLLFIAIFFLIGIILFFSNWQLIKRHKELLLKTGALEKEISFLEEKNDKLKDGIASIVDENYLEKEAREKFQLAKPGEKVVVVLPPENQTEQAPLIEEKSFLEKILESLGL
ncbi:septum formation initiator family protein [Candidatus Parcubacteria bacterium]|nr:septum formation initiator family protein [Patescibacteria group bacterium]MBU4466827.1 septum formation initiator family protein [Patescibacteria group bacterium]MCG2688531.1 septum formation initiator family protein [Candidatus Parcubacteria bacterium]